MNCILADTTFSWADIMIIVQLLPIIFFLLGGGIGFATGLRKMSRSGISWLIAVGLYAFLLGVFQKSLGESHSAITAIITMLSCAFVGMVFYFVANRILEPREKEIKQSDIRKILEKEDKFRRIEEEEIEELRRDRKADEDDFERLERRQRRRRRKYLEKMRERTSFLSRVIAAFECAIVSVFVIGNLTDATLLLISASSLSTGGLAELCELKVFKEMVASVDNKVFDYLLIGAMMVFIKKGYEKGILSSIHSLFSSVSSIVALALGFYIPFSALGAADGAFGFTADIVNKVALTLEASLAGSIPFALPANVYQLVGQIAAGLGYSIVFLIIMAMITKILFRFVELSYNSETFHFFDGCLGVFLGMATCLIVLVCGLAILLLMENMSWVSGVAELLSGTQTAEIYNALSGVLSGIMQTIAGFLSKVK